MIWNEALILTNVEKIGKEKIDDRDVSSEKKEKQDGNLGQG